MMMLRATGMFLVVSGIIWALQGSGLLNWPAGSFMLGEQDWTARGLATAAAGAVLLLLVNYRSRR
ncbi:MAG: hypothetical protein O9293_05460 [Porphyrobacter sp.]|nr:hypothetical protein [Porphyrobacter sp.]